MQNSLPKKKHKVSTAVVHYTRQQLDEEQQKQQTDGIALGK
jgi:hypothetical protein